MPQQHGATVLDCGLPMEHISALGAWESFYVIVGSSGAALTGLQFVVMALVADTRPSNTGGLEIAAFGTPTVVHFCVVLLLSGILSAPWPSLLGPDFALGACGLGGIAYTMIVIRRARRQHGYKPVLEDWLWHVVFPLLAYVVTLASAVLLSSAPRESLFLVAGSALLLLFVGIHNAWDTVTFVVIDRPRSGESSREG